MITMTQWDLRISDSHRSRVERWRLATLLPLVSSARSPNRACTFRYAPGSPGTTVKAGWFIVCSTDKACVECRVARHHPSDHSSPRMFPPSSQLYRFPACLRRVHGFPMLRLLRRLRPSMKPSLVYAASSAFAKQLIEVPVFRRLTFAH